MDKKKLDKIFGDNQASVILIDFSGELLYYNKQANLEFEEDFIHQKVNFFDLVHSLFYSEIKDFFQDHDRLVAKKKMLLTRNGRQLFPVSITFSKLTHLSQQMIMLVIENLFDIKPHVAQPTIYLKENQCINILAITDRSLQYLHVEPEYLPLLNLTQEDFENKSFFDFVDPKDYKKILSEFYNYVSGKSILNSYLYRSVIKDRTLFWFESRIKCLQGNEGEITGFVVNHILITKQINKGESQPIFVQRTDEMLLLLDRNYHLEYLSPNIKELLGYTQNYFPINYFPELVHPDDQPLILKIDESAIKNEFELRLHHRNGHFLRFRAQLKIYYNNDGEWYNKSIQLINLLSSPEEIEQGITNASKQNPEERLFQIIFEETENALLLIDKETLEITTCNRKILQLFEIEHKVDLQGLSFFSFQEKYLTNNLLQESQLKKDNQFSELKFMNAKGIHFIGNLITKQLHVEGKATILVQIIDVTQQKAYEDELSSAKESAEYALKAQESFLSTISHEIRTPLNSVLGMTHLLLQNNPREDQIRFIQTLKFSGDSLLALIDEILDYSKSEAGKLELENHDFNLKKFIHSVKLNYKNLATNKGLAFRLLTEEEVPEFIKGDITRLGQILNNLLNNAIKFTVKGQVVLSIYVEQEEDDRYLLLFEVSDTGIGIPEDKLEVIFDPFKQASSSTTRFYGGTGLGLAIVKNLVELYGGSISLHSKEGEGTAFRVILPFQKSEEQISFPADYDSFIAEYQPFDGLKVLYVEDVLPNQFLMEGLADNWNIKLDTALNGLEALEKVKQNKYDLILMDIQMPEMDGYEATQEIRNLQDPHYANIPIVALSASVSDITRQKIRNTGMNDYISKPINPEDLHRKLAEISKSIANRDMVITNPEMPNEQPTGSSVNEKADFEELRNLYSNDASNYIQVLMQISELISETIPGLIEALQEESPERFSAKRHNIIAYIKLFKLDYLYKLLETGLEKSPTEQKSTKELIRTMQEQLKSLLESIQQEINNFHES